VANSEEVLELIGPLRGRRLLEVGCQHGENLLHALNKGAIVWGVDESAALLQRARLLLPSADLRLGSADELPFDNGTFDVVCRFGAIAPGHASVSATSEMSRVCRPGGLVVLTLVVPPHANPDHQKNRTVILMR
jgi:SAM-dependent methyltransferase